MEPQKESIADKLKKIQKVNASKLAARQHSRNESSLNSLSSSMSSSRANRTVPSSQFLDESHSQRRPSSRNCLHPPESPMLPVLAELPSDTSDSASSRRPPRPQSVSRDHQVPSVETGRAIPASSAVNPSAGTLTSDFQKSVTISRSPSTDLRKRSKSSSSAFAAPRQPSQNLSATPATGRSSMKKAVSESMLAERFVINNISYHVQRQLGKGSSCKVYDVLREDTNAAFAVKVVDMRGDEAIRTSYLSEVAMLEQLEGASHVIHMYDYEWCDNDDKLYLVLERGESDFGTFLNQRSVDWSLIRFYWGEMLNCVKDIHEHNIVHSDLKPANFLFVKGHLKLIDFGIASSIPSNQTSVLKESAAGTLSYMPPEALTALTQLCNSDNYEQSTTYRLPLKSDVWSLGCILYKMVYGTLPFDRIRDQRMKMAAIVNPEAPIKFDECDDHNLLDTLKLCLQRDLSKRATLDQLLNHPYMVKRSSSPATDLLQFAEDVKENTPNTVVRKLKSLLKSANRGDSEGKNDVRCRLEFE